METMCLLVLAAHRKTCLYKLLESAICNTACSLFKLSVHVEITFTDLENNSVQVWACAHFGQWIILFCFKLCMLFIRYVNFCILGLWTFFFYHYKKITGVVNTINIKHSFKFWTKRVRGIELVKWHNLKGLTNPFLLVCAAKMWHWLNSGTGQGSRRVPAATALAHTVTSWLPVVVSLPVATIKL